MMETTDLLQSHKSQGVRGSSEETAAIGKGSSSISSDVSSSTDHTPTKAQKNVATSEGDESVEFARWGKQTAPSNRTGLMQSVEGIKRIKG
ncbi:hypothetical protein H920_08400 [Fukomys damarensis]|uniref:Uncharacterized protein n=1 Tax=Fukomys damarensis TaxID=885580 RepID=A0A091DIY8_FUKDA|nr:hypothetical protein H920_08400 [Fukomys damarensis]